MSQLIKSIKENKFLPASAHFIKPRWYDSDELFLENLKTQPADWYYRTAEVNYTLNSLGYRAPEFDTVNWEDSVVIFGCSQCFGIGVDDADTLSAQLSKLIGKPVINMGISGAATMLSFHNSIILKNICAKPLAVIQMWSHHDRAVYYGYETGSAGIMNCGIWNYEIFPYTRAWLDDLTHSKTHALFASMASKHLWSNTKFYEFSLFEETANAINCDYPAIIGGEYGRDLLHHGRNTNKILANQIAKKLF